MSQFVKQVIVQNGLVLQATASQIDSAALTPTGVVAGSYGDSSHPVSVTVDSAGRITSLASNSLPSTLVYSNVVTTITVVPFTFQGQPTNPLGQAYVAWDGTNKMWLRCDSGGNGNIYGTGNAFAIYTNGGSNQALLLNGNNLSTAGTATATTFIGAQKTVTTAYAATVNDETLLASATGGAFTITLPTPSNVPLGKKYYIKKVDPSYNSVTIAGNGGVFDGVSQFLLTAQWQTLVVEGDNGVNYRILSSS